MDVRSESGTNDLDRSPRGAAAGSSGGTGVAGPGAVLWYPLWAQPVWRAMVSDAGVGVAVVDRRSEQALYCNATMGDVLGIGGGGAEQREPRALTAMLAPKFVVDWLSMADLAVASGAPVVLRTRCAGRLVQITCRVVNVEDRSGLMLLFTARLVTRGDDTNWGEHGAVRVEAKYSDAGAMDGLSPQQLTVLRLIGLGLSTADIAARMFRTPKTVEWHRMTLGKKLGAKSRVELARIAIEAGLTTNADRNATAGDSAHEAD